MLTDDARTYLEMLLDELVAASADGRTNDVLVNQTKVVEFVEELTGRTETE